jgi:hypothetical protein
MLATVKLSKWCQTNRHPWFSSFFVSSNPLSRKSWEEPQVLEYRIHWEINHSVERGYLWMGCLVYKQWITRLKCWHLWLGCPVYKQWITWLKDDTYGWNILFTNNKSRRCGGISITCRCTCAKQDIPSVGVNILTTWVNVCKQNIPPTGTIF